MTKKEIINAIQLREAQEWELVKANEDAFGVDSPITSRSITKWNAIYELRQSLGLRGLSRSEYAEIVQDKK